MFFRKRTIFHIEDNAPEEEELRKRFRRRVLFLGLIFFLTLTAAPMVTSMVVDFQAMSEIRKVAQMIQRVREVSMTERVAVQVEWLPERQEWGLYRTASGESCAVARKGPPEPFSNSGIQWKFRLKLVSGEAVEGKTICFDPKAGLALDGYAVEKGTLLLTAALQQQPSMEAGYILLGDYGSEVQLLTNWTSRKSIP
jgi:hypothetical protein